ncbi:MAG: helix-turn-helix transcriptional regulator [Rubrivivax sp.]|nr:helix-turn-helix transcriptional regulator [Rubrivivax sp.]
MDQAAHRADFGTLLRRWRGHRGLSQLALSLDAGVSTRHLSWLEGGKSQPSRAMVLRLATRLDLPLRERNALLVAAGFAPLYAERPMSDPALAPALAALRRLLAALEPNPALAVDRHWNLVAHNRLVPPFLAAVAESAPGLLRPPVNVLRLSLHPQGLAPLIENLAPWRGYVLHRLARQVAATDDPELARLHAELQALPPPAGAPTWPARPARPAGEHTSDEADAAAAGADVPPPDVAVPLALRTPHGTLRFLTTLTVFGAPRDVTLSELAVEAMLPADEATAAALREIAAGLAA